MENTPSFLGATVISSWKYGFRQDSRTCMSFHYRLLGYETTMQVSVETNSAIKQVIWQEKNLEKNTSWRHGRIFVGFLPRYRVSRVSTFLPHACKPLLTFPHVRVHPRSWRFFEKSLHRFQVSLSAKLKHKTSEASVDNVRFSHGYCTAKPVKAKGSYVCCSRSYN